MPHPYYMAIQGSIGRAETAQAAVKAPTFSRPDEEISSSTVTTTVSDTTATTSGSINEQGAGGRAFLGEIK